MHLYLQSFIIGLISALACHFIQIKLLHIKKKHNTAYKMNILISFICGALIHHIVIKSNLESLYCRKICYDDKCIIVCNMPEN